MGSLAMQDSLGGKNWKLLVLVKNKKNKISKFRVAGADIRKEIKME